ncbi:MAG: adenylosuccinate lyase [Candidatus Latescibacterota bacterium]|nr:adenylosuccinate lyase [Candidatus Latescibacterota bacterium]
MTTPESLPNVLAHRYASAAVNAIWSEEGRIRLERRFWIAVLMAQRDLGIEIPDTAIVAYESVVDQVDLGSIRERETTTRHDVKARIEEFCALAGCEYVHKGMTSRDLTDNVEQYQIYQSLQAVTPKYVRLLDRLRDRAVEWRDVVIVGRTHHAAAQPTTMGKRLAMYGQEMLIAFRRLEDLIAHYPLRGLVGAVGTGVDQLTLFEGDGERLQALQARVLEHLGFAAQAGAVGQVYPRSLDFEVASCLYQLGGGIANLARTVRLMAGAETATEGFAPGQVGSSAMPHKMNTRSTERINGLQVILGGYAHMLGGLVGDQWFEGDVSCSVVRRAALPDSFFAFDGLVETALHVVDDMGIYEAVLARELERFLPFLATTTLLMESVRNGGRREEIHEAIKKHAVAAALDMREQTGPAKDLAARLGADSHIPLSSGQIEEILSRGRDFTGQASGQVDGFSAQVDSVVSRYPAAKDVRKSRML